MTSIHYCLNYRFNIKKLLLLGCMFCVFGCSFFKPQLTTRYDKAFLDPNNAGDRYVTVSAFTTDQPASKDALADSRSTSALITAVGTKAKDFQELGSDLAKLEIIKKKEGDIDKTTFKKRIVFSVDKTPFQQLPEDEPNKDFGLADRINNLTVKLTIKNDGVIFANWDKFITQYESVALGTDTLTRGGTASLAASVGAIGTVAPVTITPSVTASRSLEEAVALTQRRITLVGEFSKGGREAKFRQEGAVGTDLTGTFLIDLDIKPMPGKEWEKVDSVTITKFSLPKKDPKASDAAKLSLELIKLKYLKFSEPIKPITCEFYYDYILRHAKSDRIIAEGYQDVVFYKGTDVPGQPENEEGKAILTLLTKDELKARVYRIEDRQHHGHWIGIKHIPDESQETIKKPGEKANVKSHDENDPMQLGFSTFTDANDFLNWLKGKDNNVNKFLEDYKPFIPDVEDGDLKRTDIDNLRIKIEPLNY